MSSDEVRDDGAAEAAPMRRPGTVTAAAAVAALQAAALAAWGMYVVLGPLFSQPGDLLRAEVGGLTLLLTGLLPAFAASGLWRLKRWGRGPAVTIDLCMVPVGYTVWGEGGGLTWIGILVMATAIAALVCLVTPGTGRALGVYRTVAR